MTKIYALLCPQTGGVKYVGKTERFLGARLASHVMECYRGRTKYLASPKNDWLRSILEAEMMPGIRMLEKLEPGEDWEAAEIKWIAHFRALLGDALLNTTDGGKGPRGYIPNEETRAKISASGKARAPYARKPHSEETKAKISAALKGNRNLEGHTHSPESRAKMSASGKVRPTISDETRAKLSAVRVGHPVSEEARAKIGAKVAAAAARKRALEVESKPNG